MEVEKKQKWVSSYILLLQLTDRKYVELDLKDNLDNYSLSK